MNIGFRNAGKFCQFTITIFLVYLLKIQSYKGFPCGLAGKESACNEGDLGSTPGLGRSPGEGKGYPLQFSGLENSMDYIVHGVSKSRTQLSNFHFTSQFIQFSSVAQSLPEYK